MLCEMTRQQTVGIVVACCLPFGQENEYVRRMIYFTRLVCSTTHLFRSPACIYIYVHCTSIGYTCIRGVIVKNDMLYTLHTTDASPTRQEKMWHDRSCFCRFMAMYANHHPCSKTCETRLTYQHARAKGIPSIGVVYPNPNHP